MVAVDQMVVMERISTFTDAMASMFMMYYVMNIDYPAEVCATLEFLQRYFVTITFRFNKTNHSERKCWIVFVFVAAMFQIHHDKYNNKYTR